MNKLEIQNISLSYNHHPVVTNLSFQVVAGQILGLIGPNGCGKSTIIKALSRVIAIQSGQIKLDGKVLNAISRSQAARLIGVVPQNPSMPDAFTVAEIVLLGRTPFLGLLRHESASDLKIVGWAMERTGIAGLAERRVSELSGGERQRVTIARVLAQGTGIVLLDEPTANLDINHQTAILDLIRDLCQENKLAVMITLHDLNLAAQYCDKLILLKDGRLFADGTPQQVVTAENIRAVYGMESHIYPHPENHLPVVLVSHKTDTDSSKNNRISKN
jgi:iron complex transport system ATP-binding protein